MSSIVEIARALNSPLRVEVEAALRNVFEADEKQLAIKASHQPKDTMGKFIDAYQDLLDSMRAFEFVVEKSKSTEKPPTGFIFANGRNAADGLFEARGHEGEG